MPQGLVCVHTWWHQLLSRSVAASLELCLNVRLSSLAEGYRVCASVQIANKIHRQGGSESLEMYWSQFWRPGSPRPARWQVQCVTRASIPVPDSHVLVWWKRARGFLRRFYKGSALMRSSPWWLGVNMSFFFLGGRHTNIGTVAIRNYRIKCGVESIFHYLPARPAYHHRAS